MPASAPWRTALRVTAVVAAALAIPVLATGQRALPRTPDGRPDLQGYWTNETFTPLERPAELGDKEFFTAQEAAAYLKQRLDQFKGQASTDIHYDDAIWQGENYDSEPNLRTS